MSNTKNAVFSFLKKVSYDAGNFLPKINYRKWFFRGSDVILFSLKETCHLCAQNVATAAQRNNFNGIVTPYMKRFNAKIAQV